MNPNMIDGFAQAVSHYLNKAGDAEAAA